MDQFLFDSFLLMVLFFAFYFLAKELVGSTESWLRKHSKEARKAGAVGPVKVEKMPSKHASD